MPIITISREFGSGGSEVAGRVARALGWALLDNAFVERVADRLGVPREEISEREERFPTLLERLTDALAFSAPELLPPVGQATVAPSEDRIVEVSRRVVEEAVAQGPVVVVGRGAQTMLAERADAIHVFCYAPREAEVARVARRSGMPPEEARRAVEDTNRDREQYVRHYWRRAWRDPANYHLCVNTDWLGVDGAAALVVALARERFTAGSES